MNILIYFGPQLNPQRGGTERVACMIADYLQGKGHEVKYMASHPVDGPLSRDSAFLPDGGDAPTERNIAFVKEFVAANKIDAIINEGASTEAIYVFSHEHLPANVRIISHLHFSVLDDIRNFYPSLHYPLCGVPLKHVCIHALKWLKAPYNKRLSLHNKAARYQYMHAHSDCVAVLSPNQKRAMEDLLGLASSDKVVAALNPTFVEVEEQRKKENIILFVGRLDYSSKRADRVLKVWQKVQNNLQGWQLIIVGSGNDEERLKKLSKKLCLRRTTFTGQTDSAPYYAKAKMLLLTSNYEGTPMVITEAMAAGAVPIVMDTFADAGLSVVHGKNGMLTPAFDLQAMANAVMDLANDERKCSMMGLEARKAFEAIDNNERLALWDNLLN